MNRTSESKAFEFIQGIIMVESVKFFFQVNKAAVSFVPFIKLNFYIICQFTYGTNRTFGWSEAELTRTELIFLVRNPVTCRSKNFL